VKVEFSWSVDRGALEISYGTANHAGVREDFVTLPDQPLCMFGGPQTGEPRRRIVLSPRFALVAVAETAAGGQAEAPVIFEPDPDAIRIQAASSALVLHLLPGAPREVIERLAKQKEKDDAGRTRPRAPSFPLLWIDARSRPAPEDELRLRALASGWIGESAGVLFDEDGRTLFKGPSGDGVAHGPRPIRIDGWRSLREAALAAIEIAVLAAEPPVVRLPVEENAPGGGKPAELWTRSIATAALQPSIALPADILVACATGEPAEPGERGERVRIARRLIRTRAALQPLLGHGLMPLFIEHPEEEGAWRARDEWLLGRDILVAPVLEEGKQGRVVYFPEGTWLRLEPAPASGAPSSFRGPGPHTVDVPTGQVGLFAREGGDASLARALAEALRGDP
jgi:glycosyl hydrolase family 31